MQSLAAQRAFTRSLQSLGGGDGFMLSRKAQTSVTRMAVFPASPSPSHQSSSSADASSKKQIPRMEPFNQSRIVRGMRELSLIEKAEHALSDRCLELEGDEAYRCWEALFQLEKMKDECNIQGSMSLGKERSKDSHALEHLEHFVRHSGGVSILIDNLLMLAKTSQLQKTNAEHVDDANSQNAVQSEDATTEANPASEFKLANKDVETERHEFPEPGCLPKTEEELELEQNALMPESDLTRLLRRRGISASWFTKPPEHETD